MDIYETLKNLTTNTRIGIIRAFVANFNSDQVVGV